ncbi:tyrosine-type recombinase/integrase [Pseudobutyrivibrio xylanivorans]|uniref:Tyrosine-type recombinase/integrase n=1 Tax=Pseudobutyrivibrio xylanivorans TaxID=185007 RepID=A0A5P6VND9_PSEXY|nr:tyrosine-type recombinase/integrase [Pseudobutyrivibrio xylanivorans]QFJ53922.1 tyrosine-type recombinase/integrase [Pseudobutyrivibrio xylanivorans]
MTSYKDYEYQSVLAPYIRDFISQMRALGFIYNVKGYQLYRFDRYWADKGFDGTMITIERLEDWLKALPQESKSSHTSRISAVRSLSIYLNTLGIKSYVPVESVGKDYKKVHIFSKSELQELFNIVDSYLPKSFKPSDFRMANEYPVMFRLYYCCGMRNSEVCLLKGSDVDIERGIITIYDGKNRRDRLIYLSEDMRVLIEDYWNYIRNTLGHEPVWFFPGRYADDHMKNTSVDKRFREFWLKTEASSTCVKTPTPHSLRHTFVVDRINQWILEGKDLNTMLIYLSKYLGHKNPDESFYYYHLVDDAFKILKKYDKLTDEVIPEVRRI